MQRPIWISPARGLHFLACTQADKRFYRFTALARR